MKNPLKKSKPETPMTTEELLTLIQNGDLKKFKEQLEKEDISLLTQRQHSLSASRKEVSKPQALETTQERQRRNALLMEAQTLLTQEIARKTRMLKDDAWKQQEAWKQEIIPQIVPDLRWNVDQARLYKHGLITFNAMNWQKFTDTSLEITTLSGTKATFDLYKVPPPYIKMLHETAFAPILFPLESGAMKNGKKVGHWQPSEFDERQKMKFVLDQYIAIMRV